MWASGQLMLVSLVALFASDNSRLFAAPLIVANLLVPWEHARERRRS